MDKDGATETADIIWESRLSYIFQGGKKKEMGEKKKENACRTHCDIKRREKSKEPCNVGADSI